jgi:hypothetical protein
MMAVRCFGKYLQMMDVLSTISSEVFESMTEIFYFFLGVVWEHFARDGNTGQSVLPVLLSMPRPLWYRVIITADYCPARPLMLRGTLAVVRWHAHCCPCVTRVQPNPHVTGGCRIEQHIGDVCPRLMPRTSLARLARPLARPLALVCCRLATQMVRSLSCAAVLPHRWSARSRVLPSCHTDGTPSPAVFVVCPLAL